METQKIKNAITAIELNFVLLKLFVLQTLYRVKNDNPALTTLYFEYNDDYVPTIDLTLFTNLTETDEIEWQSLMALSLEPTDMDIFKVAFINKLWDKYTSDILMINFDSHSNTPVIYYDDEKVRWDDKKVKPTILQPLWDISKALCMVLFNELTDGENGMVFEAI
jgi:hypothetical protein